LFWLAIDKSLFRGTDSKENAAFGIIFNSSKTLLETLERLKKLKTKYLYTSNSKTFETQ
jgi:hypothetical protein